MLTDRVTMKTETIFSDDRKHRYLLRKEWDVKKPKATIIMTNPSTADILMMDYTTLYIINNLVRLDFGSVDIVNLLSKATTKLQLKQDLDDAMNSVNLEYITKSVEKADNIIIAWGKLGENNKKVRDLQDDLLNHLKSFKEKLYEIADGQGNSGFHPLAPQVRSVWVLKKYEPIAPKGDKPEKREKTEKIEKPGT
jgi:hypothetical protein